MNKKSVLDYLKTVPQSTQEEVNAVAAIRYILRSSSDPLPRLKADREKHRYYQEAILLLELKTAEEIIQQIDQECAVIARTDLATHERSMPPLTTAGEFLSFIIYDATLHQKWAREEENATDKNIDYPTVSDNWRRAALLREAALKLMIDHAIEPADIFWG